MLSRTEMVFFPILVGAANQITTYHKVAFVYEMTSEEGRN
jgi:hypothetical protein